VRWDFMKNFVAKRQHDRIRSGDLATVFPISQILPQGTQAAFLARPKYPCAERQHRLGVLTGSPQCTPSTAPPGSALRSWPGAPRCATTSMPRSPARTPRN
jgi:hypothetical protein